EWAEDLKTGKIKLALEIEIPDIKDTVRNLARVAWFSEINKENETKKFVMGLKFIDSTTVSQDTIKEYIINSYLG
ncbi:MAG: hypothetical protein ABIC18_02520, partial [Candidatus Omnitrophota bacterium]